MCNSHCMHRLLWLSHTSYFSYRLYLHVSYDCLWLARFCNGVLLCFLWGRYLILYTWSGFHASEFSLWYSLPVGIFSQFVNLSTINNWLTFSCRVVVVGITENKSLLVSTSKFRNVCYLRKMRSLVHCFFHSDVPHSHLWSLSVLNTISIMMSLLMVTVRFYITQMVQILRNPSLCLEAGPWLMFISDAISSLPLFCCPGYADRSAL